MSYLRSYPFDTLKIDRSFIHDMISRPAAQELVSVAIARGLGLNVISEGVETQDQFTYLARHECDIVQGFLFSQPVSPVPKNGLF